MAREMAVLGKERFTLRRPEVNADGRMVICIPGVYKVAGSKGEAMQSVQVFRVVVEVKKRSRS